MKVSAKDLIEVVRLVGNVPARSGILSSEFLRIESTGQQLQISLAAEMFSVGYIKATVPDAAGFEFYAERKMLVAFILAARNPKDTDTFDFQHQPEDRILQVRYKRRRARLRGVDAITGYQRLPHLKTRQIALSSDQLGVLKTVRGYAPDDPTLEGLNCVYLRKGVGMLATDRVSAMLARDQSISITVPIPVMLPDVMDSSGVTGVCTHEDGTVVKFDRGYVYQGLNKKCATDFPADQVIKLFVEAAKLRPTLELSGTTFGLMIDRVASYVSAGKDETLVEWVGKSGDNFVYVSAESGQGDFREQVHLTGKLHGSVGGKLSLRRLLPLVTICRNHGLRICTTDSLPYYFFRIQNSPIQMIHSKIIR